MAKEFQPLDLQPVYHCIRNWLVQRNREHHVAYVIGGSSPAQWLSTEAFAAINWSRSGVLRAGLCAYNEYRKRNIAIYDGDEEDSRLLGSLETKVIHNNGKQIDRIAKLHHDIQYYTKKDRGSACAHGAVVYVVWSTRLLKTSIDDYLLDVERCITAAFDPTTYRQFPAQGFDEIVPPTQLRWPKPFGVALYSKFLMHQTTPPAPAVSEEAATSTSTDEGLLVL